MPRDSLGFSFQVCSEVGCRRYPLDAVTGAPKATNARRWWCEQHRAGHEDDMQPWRSTLRFAAGGGLELGEEVEAEHERLARDGSQRRAEREQRRAARTAQLPAVEAERLAERAAWVPPI